MYFMTDDDIFGHNVQYLRTKHGMSREQLAAILDITPYQLQQIELGYLRDIEWPLLDRLCQEFQVKPYLIMRYDITPDIP